MEQVIMIHVESGEVDDPLSVPTAKTEVQWRIL